MDIMTNQIAFNKEKVLTHVSLKRIDYLSVHLEELITLLFKLVVTQMLILYKNIN